MYAIHDMNQIPKQFECILNGFCRFWNAPIQCNLVIFQINEMKSGFEHIVCAFEMDFIQCTLSIFHWDFDFCFTFYSFHKDLFSNSPFHLESNISIMQSFLSSHTKNQFHSEFFCIDRTLLSKENDGRKHSAKA